MEQNFQTSFIPKKPIVKERTTPVRGVGFIFILSIFIFITAVAAYGFAYVYKGNLTKTLKSKESSLTLARDRFEPERIAELKTLDKRMRAANEILSGHIVASPIFKELETITMKNVRYTDFNFGSTNDGETKIAIKLKGEAVGYRAVAMQADLFSKNKNFVDPVFSNLSLDAKGHVTFDVDFSVDPVFVNYKEYSSTYSAGITDIMPVDTSATDSTLDNQNIIQENIIN